MSNIPSSPSPPQRAASDPVPTQRPGSLDPTLGLPPGTAPGAPPECDSGPRRYVDVYELVEKLGEGGMGAVWKARHTKLDKLVALKLLPSHLMADPDAVNRFAREMKAVGKLEHPHIVRAMDAGEADGIHYLVMEYVEGTDLSRLVKSRGPRPIAEACQMIRHAALGLAHAHEHGLVHRDIKPSNLLLSKKGLVKILDLGLARLQDDKIGEGVSLTTMGDVMGTPDYMAPEQWQSAHTAGPAADLYSLGCTLFHLLTGRPPFADEQHSTFGNKMKAHLLEPPPTLRQLRPEVPDEVDALCQRLLAKATGQRPNSAKELASELHEMLKGWAKATALPETIPWVPPSPRAAPGRDIHRRSAISVTKARHWRITTWAVVGIVATIATMGLAAFAVRRPTPQPDGRAAKSAGHKESVATALAAATPAVEGPVRDSPEPPRAIAPFNAAQALAYRELWAYYLDVPLDYTNSQGMKFCLIPPGEYERGITAENRDQLLEQMRSKSGMKKGGPTSVLPNGVPFARGIESEAPRHRVRIGQPFYMGAWEVTQGQFNRVLGTNPSYFGPNGDGRDKVEGGPKPRLPVESVSFDDAVEFCRRLNRQEGRVHSPSASAGGITDGYRLPTDAEWEYACRAGTTTTFFCSDSMADDLSDFVWYRQETPKPVGTVKPNPFGRNSHSSGRKASI